VSRLGPSYPENAKLSHMSIRAWKCSLKVFRNRAFLSVMHRIDELLWHFFVSGKPYFYIWLNAARSALWCFHGCAFPKNSDSVQHKFDACFLPQCPCLHGIQCHCQQREDHDLFRKVPIKQRRGAFLPALVLLFVSPNLGKAGFPVQQSGHAMTILRFQNHTDHFPISTGYRSLSENC